MLIAFGASWDYKGETGFFGPAQWGQVNRACDGLRQSPINIDVRSAVPARRCFPVRTEGADRRAVSTVYKNDGHGFAAQTTFVDGSQPNVTGGPLGIEKYTFWNFHIHWQSEHTLNGQSYPAEIHIVHFNLKYGSIGNALDKPDGLAVVGIFFEVQLICFY